MPLSLAGFLIFLSILLGIFVASFISVPVWVMWAMFAGGTALVIVGFSRQELVLPGLICLALALGIFRMAVALQPNAELIPHFGRVIKFQGQIVETPAVSGSVARVVVETSELTGSSVRLLATVRRFPEFSRGDTVVISGKLEPLPEDNLAYRRSLLERGIEGTLAFPAIDRADTSPFSWLRILESVKQRFSQAIEHSLPEPDASFVLGVLIGERSSMAPALRDAFARTGTSHIVALSGFNITIIAVAVSWFLGLFRLSLGSRFTVSTMCILLFVLIVGGGASVVRAALMGILVLVARERGRVYDVTNALIFAAAVMALMNPYLLRFDLSFQLSFLATLGIIIVPPMAEKYIYWIPRQFGIRELMAATLSAELFVYPLLLWHFGMISLVGPFANLLILPLIPLTMLLGFLVGVTGLILPALAVVLGWVLHLLVTYQLGAIQFLSRFSIAAVLLPKAAGLAFAVPLSVISAVYVRARFRGSAPVSYA
ncbi:MAG: ComEC/Rec2 family competence protein [Candidatus Sungbacteria bacterium]|uniref:ComEC/Rec2 family competence protein n=1 Tax=Candidatus Sungiibacteriota bacterium TaxID=2750080 RepID=A0A931SDB0_9BACT|nr:ComEC/Rec2 family competence protein [Candidatus Sungbacteria bacterium]